MYQDLRTIARLPGVRTIDLHVDELDFAMVRAIADIGRSFSIQTIAEFVENKEIVAKLQELGVDYAQGYHYGKPQPINQMFD
jgi:EAL domain-containing protein (putative c-di-GMP-specific phosphodiesterase class I)